MSFNWVFYLLLTVMLFSANGLAESFISNGDFELYEPNEILGFNTPNDWDIENYAAVVTHFVPTPTQGSTRNWKIDPLVGLGPVQGNSFLVLSSGSSDVNYAEASQQIDVNEGEKISGFYFFGACDYMRWNDRGSIKLVPEPNSPPEDTNDISLVYIDVNHVGDYSSMLGWKRFDYVFDSNHTGTYKIVLSVADFGDYQLESYFCVDSLVLCNPNCAGDIYLDCRVNFADFALLSTDWLGDCSDPNYFDDPNSNCYRGTDLNEDGPVDIDDLWLFSENWLAGD